MRIGIIPHQGETFGHVARAITLVEAAEAAGAEVFVVGKNLAGEALHSIRPDIPFHSVPWSWGHRQIAVEPEAYIARVTETATAIRTLLRELMPDVILSMPGYASVQAAQAEGIRHISILHGPHITPLLTDIDRGQAGEEVLYFAAQLVRRAITTVLGGVAKSARMPEMSVDAFYASELVLAQPASRSLAVDAPAVGYIPGSFGEDVGNIDRQTCVISFGTGNPCDIGDIARTMSTRFQRVILNSYGSPLHGNLPGNVDVMPRVSSASLTGAGLAITHGGIGTLGAFLPNGTPTIAIPIELDGACNASIVRNEPNVFSLGLEQWSNRSDIARSVSLVRPDELLAATEDLLARPTTTARPTLAAGARHILERVIPR